MDLKTEVAYIMTEQVVVGNVNNQLSQAIEMFTEHDMHHLPIVDENDKFIGMINETDVLRFLREHAEAIRKGDTKMLDEKINLTDIMRRDHISIPPTTPIGEASNIINDCSFEALPIEKDGKIVGIVSIKDIVRYIHAIAEGRKPEVSGSPDTSYLEGSSNPFG